MNSLKDVTRQHWENLEDLLKQAPQHELLDHHHKSKKVESISLVLALVCAGMVVLTIFALMTGSTFFVASFLGLGLLFLLLGVGFEVSNFKRKNSLEHRDSKIKTLHMIGYGKALKTDEEKQLYSGLYHLYQQGQHSAYFWGKVKREHLAYCYYHQHSKL